MAKVTFWDFWALALSGFKEASASFLLKCSSCHAMKKPQQPHGKLRSQQPPLSYKLMPGIPTSWPTTCSTQRTMKNKFCFKLLYFKIVGYTVIDAWNSRSSAVSSLPGFLSEDLFFLKGIQPSRTHLWEWLGPWVFWPQPGTSLTVQEPHGEPWLSMAAGSRSGNKGVLSLQLFADACWGSCLAWGASEELDLVHDPPVSPLFKLHSHL